MMLFALCLDFFDDVFRLVGYLDFFDDVFRLMIYLDFFDDVFKFVGFVDLCLMFKLVIFMFRYLVLLITSLTSLLLHPSQFKSLTLRFQLFLKTKFFDTYFQQTPLTINFCLLVRSRFSRKGIIGK